MHSQLGLQVDEQDIEQLLLERQVLLKFHRDRSTPAASCMRLGWWVASD